MKNGDDLRRGSNEFHGTAAASVVQVGAVGGNVNLHLPPGIPVPAQLRSPPAYFTNRESELSALRQVSDGAVSGEEPRIAVITGPAGVGKTALALTWLYRIRRDFPDGQLFADLRGFSAAGGPAPPNEPLEAFLRALGVVAENVPLDREEQAALYRSVTAGRRLIIMLDNAFSAGQVRPLLPGHGPALVVVTTRHRLSGLALEGASFFSVDPFDEADAVRLLDRILGSERTEAEPEEARSLARLCGRLPLALCTSAARLKVRDGWPIARVVGELSDERSRLEALSVEEDISVRAVFDFSYDDLPGDAARMFRLLALHPGQDLDTAAAAALAGVGRDDAERLLDLLVGRSLIVEDESRFRFHDLIRVYARGVMESVASLEERAKAFERLLVHYLSTAVAADRLLIPGRWHLGPFYEREQSRVFAGAAEALDWLEREYANVLAVQRAAHDRALHEFVWWTSEALWGLFIHRKHYRSWLDCYHLGLESARACGDTRAQARMLCGLGAARLNLAEFTLAHDLYSQAARLDREAGHPLGEAAALEGIGVACLGSGRPEEAVAAFEEGLSLHRRLGRPRGVAMMTRRLGESLRDLGRYREATDLLDEARAYFAERGDRYNEARVLVTLAEVFSKEGRLSEWKKSLDGALSLTREIGARHEQAKVHVGLAGLAGALGDRETRRAELERALAIYGDLGAPQKNQVEDQLAALDEESPSSR